MSELEAVVLGLVQGVTEFLPVSSSGHLILVPWLFEWEQPGLAFDAALHLGTLLAVFCYFWRDLLAIARGVPFAIRHPRQSIMADAVTAPIEGADPRSANAHLAWLILIGCLPAGIIGLAAASSIDEFFHEPEHQQEAVAVVAVLLIVFAVVLYFADHTATLRRRMGELTVKDTLVIGGVQTLALLPGVSRSGITLSAGLWRGFQRADAARYSFLLGTPLTMAAGLTGLVDLSRADLTSDEWRTVGIAIAAAAVSGFLAIRTLLKFLKHANTNVFVAYRIILGSFVLVALATGWR